RDRPSSRAGNLLGNGRRSRRQRPPSIFLTTYAATDRGLAFRPPTANNEHMANGVEWRRRLPELLLGLLAMAVAVVVTGLVVAHAIRDVKRARDTITVTGSARQPISADVVHWSLAVSAEATRPEKGVRLLRTRVIAV